MGKIIVDGIEFELDEDCDILQKSLDTVVVTGRLLGHEIDVACTKEIWYMKIFDKFDDSLSLLKTDLFIKLQKDDSNKKRLHRISSQSSTFFIGKREFTVDDFVKVCDDIVNDL